MLKVLIVCSGNYGTIQPFILDQTQILIKRGIKVEYFLIKKKGFWGYLKHFPSFVQTIRKNSFHLIHAHHVLSGMLSILQRLVPVVVTFHGGDTEIFRNRLISHLVIYFSKANIFTNIRQLEVFKLTPSFKNHLIPCGLDITLFRPIEKKLARQLLKMHQNKYFVLFASNFNRREKNYILAKESVSLSKKDVELIELKDNSRLEVNYLMNAVDLLLVTSFRETGPLVVKEAMACNLPIISTDVGDVREVITGVQNCFITSYSSAEIAERIDFILEKRPRTNGREKILKYDNEGIINQIINVYDHVCKKVK